MRTLYDDAEMLGLRPAVAPVLQGPIVFNIDAPADSNWNLQHFVDGLKTRGFLISNFYNTAHPSFRWVASAHLLLTICKPPSRLWILRSTVLSTAPHRKREINAR